MKLYDFSKEDLLQRASIGLKNPITEEDIFKQNEVKLSHLKRIDKIFNKGLQFYLDPSEPNKTEEASIFFRKENFNSPLNIGSRKVVNHFEETKISLSALSKLTDLKVERILPSYSIDYDPKKIAYLAREKLYPGFKKNLKDFLSSLIIKFSEYNIFVFEFVETWNKKEKANLDGFYLSPNAIVLKRQQKSLRREIFTLIHELGHYLIDEEEIDELNYQNVINTSINRIERWCNDFSYFFLAGDYDNLLKDIEEVTSKNDYYHDIISRVSSNTHLSKLALYTRLLVDNKISPKNYNLIKKEMELAFERREKEKKKKRELEKELGVESFARSPKPIKSPLLKQVLQAAYLDGIIGEMEFCKHLNIKPKEMEKHLQ